MNRHTEWGSLRHEILGSARVPEIRKYLTLRSLDCVKKRGNFLITRRSGGRIPPPLPLNLPVWAQALCGASPVCGQGSNGWPEFVWSVLDPSIASFFDLGVTAGINGLTVGMTPVEASFTDVTQREWTATTTVDVQ